MITVYMPTHNRCDMLSRAVESVLKQDYEDFELIIVDDGSSEETASYLSQIISKDKRIRTFSNSTPRGACVSRNRAITEARGEFVTGLDDDDFFEPNHLSSLLAAYLTRIPLGPTVIFSRISTLTGKGRSNGSKQKSIVNKSDLLISNCVGNQVFTSTETMRKAGLFDVEMPAWQDYEMWLRLTHHVEFFYCTDEATYVQDESHELGRTTYKHFEVIRKAFQRCADKHLPGAPVKETLKLRVNYHSYPQVPMSLTELTEYIGHGLVLKPIYHFLRKRIMPLDRRS